MLVSGVPQFDAHAREPGAPLHRAGRRVLRPQREAGRLGRGARPTGCIAANACASSSSARAAGWPRCRRTSTWRDPTGPDRWRAGARNRYTRNTSRPAAGAGSPLISPSSNSSGSCRTGSRCWPTCVSGAIAAAYEERFGLTHPRMAGHRRAHAPSRALGREVAEKTRMDAVAVSRAVTRLLRGRSHAPLGRSRRPAPLRAAACPRPERPSIARSPRSRSTTSARCSTPDSREIAALDSICSASSRARDALARRPAPGPNASRTRHGAATPRATA